MKNLLIITAILLIGSFANSQTNQYQLDFKNPESVLNAVFYSAKTTDYSILEAIVDPLHENDADVEGFRTIPTKIRTVKQNNWFLSEDSKQYIKDFIEGFKDAKIINKPIYTDNLCTIPFSFVDVRTYQIIKEEMELINRYGNWYLYSF